MFRKALIILLGGSILVCSAPARKLSFLKMKDMAGSEAQLGQLLGKKAAKDLLAKVTAPSKDFKQQIGLKVRVNYDGLSPTAKVLAIRYALDEAFAEDPSALDRKINFLQIGIGLSITTARDLFQADFEALLDAAKIKRFHASNSEEKKKRLYYYQKGRRELKAENLDKARAAFRSALDNPYPTLLEDEKPSTAILYYALAMIEVKAKNLETAEEMLKNSLQADPSYDEAKALLARVSTLAADHRAKKEQEEMDRQRLEDLQVEYDEKVSHYASSRKKLVYVMACGVGIITIGFVDSMIIDDPVETDPQERRNELDRRKKGASAIITVGVIELLASGGFYTYYLLRQKSEPTPQESLEMERVGIPDLLYGHPGQVRVALLNHRF